MRVAIALWMMCGAAAADVSVPGRGREPGGDCNETGKRVQAIDLNGDDKPDLWKIYDGERLVCEKFSFAFDGHIDLWRHLDEKGQTALEELDVDFDGRIDLRRYFKNGKPVRTERL